MAPFAISDTAGLIRAAVKAFDPISPKALLRKNDSQGAIIPPGGAGGGTIFVEATDPPSEEANPNDHSHPVPSGIYAMELKILDTGATISPPTEIAAIGENPSIRTFSGLAEGNYELKVFDGTGNETSVLF